MFEEHTVIALTEPIGIERIEDIPPDSPLLAADNLGDGLRPGDVGTIVAAFPGVGKFLVEFVEADGYTVALAEVKATQARLATTVDLAKDRFKMKLLV